MKKQVLFFLFVCFAMISAANSRPMEYLDRGLVAMEVENGVNSKIYLSWRMLGTDPVNIGFNLYRNGQRINFLPLTKTTNYEDLSGKASDTYQIEALLTSGKEKSASVSVWPLLAAETEGKAPLARKIIPLQPAPLLDNKSYFPGDMSTGDLNGDGQYDLVFEWEGSNPFLEAIDLDGNPLWRINLGPNVNYNAVPFMVYDLDGDGKAEVACITAPGTMDGTGRYLSKGPAAEINHSMLLARDYSGTRLLEDPTFLTVFDGQTGKELATIDYFPAIGPLENMKATWGDDYGHRTNSLKGAVLYDKDLGPMLVYARGIYTRVAMAAYTFDGSNLTRVWTFDSERGNSEYRSQGNHGLTVGDVDGDGSDELMYGACAIDNTGQGLYSTGRGHGDAHALGDLMPDRPGLEYFQPHENSTYGVSMRDAATGEILWEKLGGGDVGRAWAAEVSPKHRGALIASSSYENFDCNGEPSGTTYNGFDQHLYFDGDAYKDIRTNGTGINSSAGLGRILTAWYYQATTVHSSKNDVCLQADILGDWREELIFAKSDASALILFSSWIPTERKNYTLMHDPTYRMAVATQNVGYNQPANVGFYFPDGAPTPNIHLIRYDPTVSGLNGTPFGSNSNKLSVYPNPVNNRIHLQLDDPQDNLHVRIYNLFGQKLLETNESEIDATALPSGYYRVEVINGGKTMSQSILKK